MSRYYRVTVRINGYYRTIRMYVPILTFFDDFVCLFDLLFAPIHNIIGLQVKISLYSLNTEFGCVNFAYILRQIIHIYLKLRYRLQI